MSRTHSQGRPIFIVRTLCKTHPQNLRRHPAKYRGPYNEAFFTFILCLLNMQATNYWNETFIKISTTTINIAANWWKSLKTAANCSVITSDQNANFSNDNTLRIATENIIKLQSSMESMLKEQVRISHIVQGIQLNNGVSSSTSIGSMINGSNSNASTASNYSSCCCASINFHYNNATTEAVDWYTVLPQKIWTNHY